MCRENNSEYLFTKKYHYLHPKLEHAILSNDLVKIEQVLRDKSILFKGLQPLDLAMFFDKVSIVEHLLMTRGISVETKVEKVFFDNYYKETKWRGEFGNRITLLTFAVLHDRVELAKILIRLGADVKIKSADNRSLLMCAVDNHSLEIIRMLVARMSKAEINHRDDRGITAVHYLFNQNTCLCHRSPRINEVKLGQKRVQILKTIVDGGANINMLIGANPASLLINMAAYKHECHMIEYLLPRQERLSLARPLYYAMLPDSAKHPLNYLCRARKSEFVMIVRNVNLKSINAETMGYSDQLSIKFILENIKLRMKYGFPVNSEEVQLFDTVNQKYSSCHDDLFLDRLAIFQRKSELLKNDILEYENKKLTVYEVLIRPDLMKLVKNESFLESFENFYECVMNKHIDGYYEKVIVMMLKVRVDIELHKFLMNECKKISISKKCWFYYIPKKIMLTIVNYLDNSDIKKFIEAFSVKSKKRLTH